MKKIKSLLLIAIMLGFSACKNEKGYPQAVIDNIVSSCKQQARGDGGGLCECMAEKVQEKYTYEEFMKVESELASGKQNEGFMQFMDWVKDECGAELTGD